MKGYTLIELLVVIGITAILVALAFLSLVGYEARRDLEFTGKRVEALFRDAQSRSVTQEGGQSWGVQITTNQFQLLQRDASPCGFAGGQSGIINLSTRFAPLASSNVCFDAVTGFLAPQQAAGFVTITIGLADGSANASIKIYNNGRIE